MWLKYLELLIVISYNLKLLSFWLKLANYIIFFRLRCLPRQRYPSSSIDLTSFQDSTHGHDFNQGHSRVVMTRKTERRIFVAPTKLGQVRYHIILYFELNKSSVSNNYSVHYNPTSKCFFYIL